MQSVILTVTLTARCQGRIAKKLESIKLLLESIYLKLSEEDKNLGHLVVLSFFLVWSKFLDTGELNKTPTVQPHMIFGWTLTSILFLFPVNYFLINEIKLYNFLI